MDSDVEMKTTTRRTGRGRGRGRGRPPGRPKKAKKKVEKGLKEEVIVNKDKNLDVENVSKPWDQNNESDLKTESIELDGSDEPEVGPNPNPISFVSPSSKLLHRNEPLNWKYRVNLIGEKVVNPRIHCCERCQLPVLVYGRMIACKHVFCLSCAEQYETVCPRCGEKVLRVEKTGLGTVFMCQTESCKRTYLSQRDLQAHIQHRHVRRLTTPSALNSSNNANVISAPSGAPKETVTSLSGSAPNARSISYNNSFQSPIPVVSSRSNLITVPIQEEVSTGLNPMTQTVSSQQSMHVSTQQSVSNYGPQQTHYSHHNPHLQWSSMPNTNSFGYRPPPPPGWAPINPFNNPYNRPYYPQ